MKKFINLISKDNKKHIIIFILLNIILVLFETFSIALIPLIIDIVISENPLLPQYLKSLNDLISTINKKDLLLYASIFVVLLSISLCSTCNCNFENRKDRPQGQKGCWAEGQRGWQGGDRTNAEQRHRERGSTEGKETPMRR